MGNWFATGRIVDCILPLMLLEGLLLWLVSRRHRSVSATTQVFANLASGAALMLALRSALLHAAWPAVASWLLVALAMHVCEVGARFKVLG